MGISGPCVKKRLCNPNAFFSSMALLSPASQLSSEWTKGKLSRKDNESRQAIKIYIAAASFHVVFCLLMFIANAPLSLFLLLLGQPSLRFVTTQCSSVTLRSISLTGLHEPYHIPPPKRSHYYINRYSISNYYITTVRKSSTIGISKRIEALFANEI